jgi:hypothetical protein
MEAIKIPQVDKEVGEFTIYWRPGPSYNWAMNASNTNIKVINAMSKMA